MGAREGHSFDFDCVVVLGAMPAQFSEGAMYAVLRKARLLIIDEAMTSDPMSPCAECGSFRAAKPLLQKLGFALDQKRIHKWPAAARGIWEIGVSSMCRDSLPGGLLLDCRKNSSSVAQEDINLH